MCVKTCLCNSCYKKCTCDDCKYNAEHKEVNCNKDGITECIHYIIRGKY